VGHLVTVTAPDDGVDGKDWNVPSAQNSAQAKMQAIYDKHGDSSATPSQEQGSSYKAPTNEPAFVPKGVTDASAAQIHKRKGDEAFVKGDDAVALAAYDACLACDDTNAKVFANRAAVKLRMKGTKSGVTLESLEGARIDAKNSRQIDPNYVKAWYREGTALTELRDYESAALAFFEGMQIDEHNLDLKKGFDAAIKKGRDANLKK
jgi:tetratricopeptide (TPR) repeat protein